jgi:hypothetical protein
MARDKNSQSNGNGIHPPFNTSDWGRENATASTRICIPASRAISLSARRGGKLDKFTEKGSELYAKARNLPEWQQ